MCHALVLYRFRHLVNQKGAEHCLLTKLNPAEISSHDTLSMAPVTCQTAQGYVRCYHCPERFRPNMYNSMVCALAVPTPVDLKFYITRAASGRTPSPKRFTGCCLHN